jgi:predicted nucleic acid-binding protein
VSKSRWSIQALQAGHAAIALDANVLIYVIEANEEHGPRARAVLDAVDGGSLRASIATIGQVEILAGPAGAGDATTFELTADEIRSTGMELVELTPSIAEDAAWIRGQAGVDLADAIHLASARAVGATAFVTNDRRIKARAGLEVLYLDDLALEPPRA